MSGFVCPVCGGELEADAKSLTCPKGHCFDIAASGYVNLLLSQQAKTKRHGDDRRMVRARRDFLDRGYYMMLLSALSETVLRYAEDGGTILDAGCGECWYTANIGRYLADNGMRPHLLGVDISKDALAAGSKRGGELELAVASAFHLPVADGSCDMVLSIFAPLCREEFQRVLKAGGVLMRVIPLERHLWSLKAAVYERPYENDREDPVLPGFSLIEMRELRGTIHLDSGEDILNAFSMTPYYYKTGEEDQNKLRGLAQLDTEIEFEIRTYRKS